MVGTIAETIEGKRTLRLTLNKTAFEITGTKEKPFELRRKSKWIESRVLCKKAFSRPYDYVLIMNGYGAKCPAKLFAYDGLSVLQHAIHWTFSNGLFFYTQAGDYKIHLGKLLIEQK